MSTRGMIGIQEASGAVKGFYKHTDNYPTGTGALLLLKTDITLFKDCKDIREFLDSDYDIETYDNVYAFLDAAMNWGCDFAYIRIKNCWYGSYLMKSDYNMYPVIEMICKEYENQIEELNEVIGE